MKSIEQLEKEHRQRMQQDSKYRDKIAWAARLFGLSTDLIILQPMIT